MCLPEIATAFVTISCLKCIIIFWKTPWLSYNWYTQKNCTCLMYTISWVWAHAYICDTVTTIQVLNIHHLQVSLCTCFCVCMIRTLNMRSALLINCCSMGIKYILLDSTQSKKIRMCGTQVCSHIHPLIAFLWARREIVPRWLQSLLVIQLLCPLPFFAGFCRWIVRGVTLYQYTSSNLLVFKHFCSNDL